MEREHCQWTAKIFDIYNHYFLNASYFITSLLQTKEDEVRVSNAAVYFPYTIPNVPYEFWCCWSDTCLQTNIETGGRCSIGTVCTHQVAALFCMKWCHRCHQVETMIITSKNLTPSIDLYLLEKQSCQISSWSNLKQRSLRLYEEVVQQKEQDEHRHEICSDL